MPLSAGTRLEPLEVVAPLGAGGMGEVYRAHDPRLGRDVAVKVVAGASAADPDRIGRFEQEARAAAALNHPNILAVYDVGSHDGAPYVVTELLEGETLRDILAGGGLPPRKAVEYGLQIAHGLAAAHDKGIVHRDLKPDNVFLEGNRLMAVPTATSPALVIGAPTLLFDTRIVGSGSGLGTTAHYDVAADGQRFIVATRIDAGEANPPITVVLNWQDELTRLLAAD